MNKSNIDQYVPPNSITSRMYYWIGLRKTDYVIYDSLPSMFCMLQFIAYIISFKNFLAYTFVHMGRPAYSVNRFYAN